jgi:pyruvate dehydrogenase E1 component
MLPFYIYYSMFGFQRVGDLIWAAADQRARGFLIGATAGRTTLGRRRPAASGRIQPSGGLDRSRTVSAYDPDLRLRSWRSFVDHGMPAPCSNMGKDEFYYLTVMNENYAQPSMPAGVEADIIKGLYQIASHKPKKSAGLVRLLGSGTILPQVIEAARMLANDWGVASEVWSATSFSELSRNAREAERHNRYDPLAEPVVSHLASCLPGKAPIVAATDYVRAYPQLVASYVEAPFTALGTDGFGRSDTRTALRDFFEVDHRHIAVAALASLVAEGSVTRQTVADAIDCYGLDVAADAPWLR